jgi:hypothetical protein
MPNSPANPPAKKATLIVERLPLTVLKPHPRNPRNHPVKGSPEWATLRASLESDYFDPIVWNKRNGLLVSGHLRVKVLTDAGYTEADVVVKDYDEPTHLARMLAANKLIGQNDDEAVKDLLQELDTGAFSMALSGYTSAELEKMLGVSFSQGDLADQAFEWERGIDEIAENDEEMAGYIQQLEKTRDEFESEAASGEAIARELEKFLQSEEKPPEN